MLRSTPSLIAVALLLGTACAPARPPQSSMAPSERESTDDKLEAPKEPNAGASLPAAVDVNAVEKSAKPLSARLFGSDRVFSEDLFLTKLASATAICIGESHDSVEDHYLELAIVRGMLERRSMRGFELGIGLEMVRQSSQPILSQFDSGRVSLEQLPLKTSWAEEWGYSFNLFRPQLKEALIFGDVRTLALGVSRELTHHIAELGIAGLSEKDARKVPEIDRSQGDHRKLFDALMGGHPHGDVEKMYEAQLVWDESMAHVGAKFLSERAPIRKLVIFAGAAHCHRTGIPSRIESRTPSTVVSVLREADGQPKELRDGYDYLVRFD